MNIYLLIPLLLVFLVVLIVLNKRQKQGGSESRSQRSRGSNKGSARSRNDQAESDAEEQGSAASESQSGEDWDWQDEGSSDATTVSVATVDHLTEYNVYKQFGYFQKAADSLLSYLNSNHSGLSKGMRNTLVLELAGLCLEAKNPDQLADVIDTYRDDLDTASQEDLIRKGLGLDNTNLPLRVLAESLLGWSVQKTEQEMGLDANATSLAAQHEDEDDADDVEEEGKRLALVDGNVHFFQVHEDEQEVLTSFAKPEYSYQLLKDQLPYDAAVRCLNKAIQKSDKPAGLIIDALALDYRNRQLSVFAQHLWRLYYVLGQYGQKVKERMLGWGYNLGHHPMFDDLATNPSEAKLRDMGVAQGFISVSGSAIKAKRLPVVEPVENENYEAKTPAEEVLRDAESLLTYGQLDQALDLLEEAILKYPQESQLYIMLFDLYERSDDWPRLQKMLQTIRSEIKTPPEEVVLAMSQLLQRINQNGVQKK